MKVDENCPMSIIRFNTTTKALKKMKNFFQRLFCCQYRGGFCYEKNNRTRIATTGMVAAALCMTMAVPAAAEEKEVLRVGMECAYAPFNWTQ